MENSIEEALKKLTTGKKMKIYELLRTFKREGIENFVITRKKYVDVILSDYKRVLKENEELKQDRNNNYQMIALAQNEMLGYIQGYEDGKKLKRSAVACVVENQQYYIIKKEIEHYKEYIEKLQKENKELKEINNELEAEKNEAIRRYNFETIPIKKVKDKIEELKKNALKIKQNDKYYYETDMYNKIIMQVLRELIEEREEK